MSIGPVGGNGPIDDGGKVPPVNPINPSQNPPERRPEWDANTSGNEDGTPSLDTTNNVNAGSTDISATKTTGFQNLQEAFNVIAQFQRSLEDPSLREVPLTFENYVEIGNACSLELQRDMDGTDPSSSLYLTLIESYSAGVSRLYSAIIYITSNKPNVSIEAGSVERSSTEEAQSFETIQQALNVIAEYQKELQDETLRTCELNTRTYLSVSQACVAYLTTRAISADSPDILENIRSTSLDTGRLNSATEYITRTLNPNDQDSPE